MGVKNVTHLSSHYREKCKGCGNEFTPRALTPEGLCEACDKDRQDQVQSEAFRS